MENIEIFEAWARLYITSESYQLIEGLKKRTLIALENKHLAPQTCQLILNVITNDTSDVCLHQNSKSKVKLLVEMVNCDVVHYD